jgi:hypothetical protein
MPTDQRKVEGTLIGREARPTSRRTSVHKLIELLLQSPCRHFAVRSMDEEVALRRGWSISRSRFAANKAKHSIAVITGFDVRVWLFSSPYNVIFTVSALESLAFPRHFLAKGLFGRCRRSWGRRAIVYTAMLALSFR